MSVLSILRIEAARFAAHPVYRRVVLAFSLLLLASAVWSGIEARGYRAEVAVRHAHWEQAFDKAKAAAPERPAASTAEASRAVSAAYALGRGDLAATRLPATGALVLGLQQYQALPTAVLATVDSRHTDGRVTGPLGNPLLAETGLPGFPAIVVLLVPLAALALSAGMVQEDRERGVWRLVCAQCNVGLGTVFSAALAIRWAVVFAVAALCSACAFALDPGAAIAPLGAWLLGLALFTAFWVLAGGLLSLLPVSAGAALTAALGLWLALTFAVPAALAWRAERAAPMPSRLAAIVELRAVQQDTEERDTELLHAWYDRHPDDRPAPGLAPSRPAFPVTFVPRYENLDARMRPLMRRFDHARAAQAASIEEAAWLSPSLALMLWADRLAGIDAARYSRYIDAVDRFEDRWRAFFVPRIMSYRGVSAAELSQLPVFARDESARIDANDRDANDRDAMTEPSDRSATNEPNARSDATGSVLRWLLAACALMALLAVAGRKALVRP